MEDYLMIATVLKPQGIRGECKLRSYAAQIDRFSRWHTLFLKTPQGFKGVSVRVNRIRDGFIYAVLGDCVSADMAEQYRGVDLYVDRAHAAPAEEDAELIVDLIGCEARDDQDHLIGVLSDVLQHGPVDTWVFRSGSETLMAPALKTVFTEVNVSDRIIRVNAARLKEVAVWS